MRCFWPLYYSIRSTNIYVYLHAFIFTIFTNGLKNIPYIQFNIIYYIINYAALVGLGYFFVCCIGWFGLFLCNRVYPFDCFNSKLYICNMRRVKAIGNDQHPRNHTNCVGNQNRRGAAHTISFKHGKVVSL